MSSPALISPFPDGRRCPLGSPEACMPPPGPNAWGQGEGRPLSCTVYRDPWCRLCVWGAAPPSLTAPGCCLIAPEKKAYFCLESPEAADFSVSKRFQGHSGECGLVWSALSRPQLDSKGGGSLGFLRGQACSPKIKSLQRNVFIFMDAGRVQCFIKGMRDSKASFRKFPSSWMEI